MTKFHLSVSILHSSLNKGINYLSPTGVIQLFGSKSCYLALSISGHFNYENKALLLRCYCSKIDKYLDYLWADTEC